MKNTVLQIRLILLTLFIFSGLYTYAGEEDSIRMDAVWVPDNGDGTYTNPVIFADYSDPDVVKVGDDFYMVASSFNCVPGIPVLHSKDLVNWTLIGHVFAKQPPFDVYDDPGHGVGVWAPSIRYRDGEFYVYYADPDYGIYMARASDPAGPWEHKLVQSAYGWIDPCPFWDDNDSAYLLHAYANSRIGFNSILTLRRMSQDGETISMTDTVVLFDGNDPAHPRQTIEGPKMYKRNGYYYVFAPFGGVAGGEQCVLRSDSIFGTYKDTTVLEQGLTDVNGPHQGGWVELESGESWFVHFQEYLPYGRIVHLQPVEWKNDWPYMGEDLDGDGIGEPVATHAKPDVGKSYPIMNPRTSDKFNEDDIGLQWQWHSNTDSSWWSLADNPGSLRLYAARTPVDYTNLWDVGSLLLQKLPAERFSVTTKLKLYLKPGETAGLLMMGGRYTYIGVMDTDTGMIIRQRQCTDARGGRAETTTSGDSEFPLDKDSVYLRMAVDILGKCRVSYSLDGINFLAVGNSFTTDEGRWIGAKIGLFCHRPYVNGTEQGYADFAWFGVDDYYDRLPGQASVPSPVDGDTVSVDAGFKLAWEGDAVFADSFDIFLDTGEDPAVRVATGTNKVYFPEGLQAGTTYFWRVDSRNQRGVTGGKVWKFTVGDIENSDPPDVWPGLKLDLIPSVFSDNTNIVFNLPAEASLNISLYSLNGALVRALARGRFSPGEHELQLERRDLGEGMYLLRLETGHGSLTRKVIMR